jgi:hypothetical protein
MSTDQPPAATRVIDLTSNQDSVQLDRNRAEMMEFLYHLYGRDQAPEGLRSTYTGLMEQFKGDLADFLVAQMEQEWKDPVWSAAIAGIIAGPAAPDANAPVS